MKAFLSYTRSKDKYNVVSEFRNRLKNELEIIETDAELFQDKNNIKPGDRFSEQILREIHDSEVLIVLVSPAWLKSDYCRWEFEQFIEKENGRESRILPVLWVKTDLKKDSNDDIALRLSKIQYDDWTKLRHEDGQVSTELRKRVAALAERVIEIATK